MAADRRSALLVIMARAPVPGQVKTRLIPMLGRIGAARVYRRLLKDTVSRLACSNAYDIKISCSPDTLHPVFRSLARNYGCGLARQPLGKLGLRMSRIISRQLKTHDSVIVVGSDLVNLNTGRVEQAFRDLDLGADLVLGKTLDGGYGLIGMKRLHSELFTGVPWSSPRVADITLNKARRLGLQVGISEGLLDIDHPQDYYRWLKRRIY